MDITVVIYSLQLARGLGILQFTHVEYGKHSLEFQKTKWSTQPEYRMQCYVLSITHVLK